jgi:hypothetical protein
MTGKNEKEKRQDKTRVDKTRHEKIREKKKEDNNFEGSGSFYCPEKKMPRTTA